MTDNVSRHFYALLIAAKDVVGNAEPAPVFGSGGELTEVDTDALKALRTVVQQISVERGKS